MTEEVRQIHLYIISCHRNGMIVPRDFGGNPEDVDSVREYCSIRIQGTFKQFSQYIAQSIGQWYGIKYSPSMKHFQLIGKNDVSGELVGFYACYLHMPPVILAGLRYIPLGPYFRKWIYPPILTSLQWNPTRDISTPEQTEHGVGGDDMARQVEVGRIEEGMADLIMDGGYNFGRICVEKLSGHVGGWGSVLCRIIIPLWNSINDKNIQIRNNWKQLPLLSAEDRHVLMTTMPKLFERTVPSNVMDVLVAVVCDHPNSGIIHIKQRRTGMRDTNVDRMRDTNSDEILDGVDQSIYLRLWSADGMKYIRELIFDLKDEFTAGTWEYVKDTLDRYIDLYKTAEGEGLTLVTRLQQLHPVINYITRH